jgi:hypothetical protein
MVATVLHFPNFAEHPATNHMLKRVFLNLVLYWHFPVKLFGLKDLLHKVNLVALMDFGNRVFFIGSQDVYLLLRFIFYAQLTVLFQWWFWTNL